MVPEWMSPSSALESKPFQNNANGHVRLTAECSENKQIPVKKTWLTKDFPCVSVMSTWFGDKHSSKLDTRTAELSHLMERLTLLRRFACKRSVWSHLPHCSPTAMDLQGFRTADTFRDKRVESAGVPVPGFILKLEGLHVWHQFAVHRYTCTYVWSTCRLRASVDIF